MKSAVLLGVVIGLIAASVWLLSPVSTQHRPGVFVVPEKRDGFDVSESLQKQGYIKSAAVFQLLFFLFAKDKQVDSGGYRLDPAMNARQILTIVTTDPELLWVTVYGCRRKEETSEIIDQTIGWSEAQFDQWNGAYRSLGQEYIEGVYYPDTYLIAKDASGADVARKFIDRFNEVFTPVADRFTGQDIKWTTGLKIASLISREAAGPEDMKLISGIIWNRLNRGMKLEIDVTMQYTRGRRPDGGWWGQIDLSQKRNDSPYNSYRYSGLPPTPICSPTIDAITAVLEPEETDCLFYLHDKNKQIHCAETYEEHKENIGKYL